jgi:agmatine deiminase
VDRLSASDPVEWPGFLGPAQEQIAAFANAVAESGQEVRLLVRDEANEPAPARCVSEAVKLERRVYGDVWLRDTGPLVVLDEAGNRRPAVRLQRLGRQVPDGRATGNRRGTGARCRAGDRANTPTGSWKAGRWMATAPGWSRRPNNACSTPTATRTCRAPIEARLARDLGSPRAVAGRWPDQRSHRWPCRQPGALCRARACWPCRAPPGR